jgi:hypothetical protein
MFRRSSVLLVSLISLRLFAASGRPVTDFRYDTANFAAVTCAASDGEDFLLITENGGLRGQMIRNGQVAGPPFLISGGVDGYIVETASVVWTGSAYLVSWSDGTSIFIATIARGGGLLAQARRIAGGSFASIVTNGRRILVWYGRSTDIAGTFLDPNGNSIGTLQSTLPPPNGMALSRLDAAGDGFVLLAASRFAAGVLRLDGDGKPLAASWTVAGDILAEGHVLFDASIGAHGDTLLVLFVSRSFNGLYFVRSAVFGARGEIVKPAKPLLTLGHPLVFGAVTWDGTAFTGVASDTLYPLGYRASLTRVDANGNLVNESSFISAAFHASPFNMPVIVSTSERETLVVFNMSFVTVPRGSVTATKNPVSLLPFLNTHDRVLLNAMGDQYLVAWNEYGVGALASRIDRDGRYLDGAGISIGIGRIDGISSDGTNWLVAWNGGYATRVSRGGDVLDKTPISLNLGYDVSIAWTGRSYLASGNSIYDLATKTLSRDGAPGELHLVAAAAAYAYPDAFEWGHPTLACDAQRCVLAAMYDHIVDHGQAPSHHYSLYAFPLDLNGVPAGPSFLVDPDSTTAVTSAASATHVMVLDRTKVAIFPAASPAASPAMIDLNEPPPTGGSIAFDGHDFIVALKYLDGVTMMRLTPGGVPFDRRHVALTLWPLGVSYALARYYPPAPSFSLAAGNSAAPLLAFVARDETTGGMPRAATLFLSDLDPSIRVPAAPARVRVSQTDPSHLTVAWDTPPAAPAGYSVEVRAIDGAFRQVVTAPGASNTALVPLLGSEAAFVRVVAWNAAGTSDPSGEATLITMPRRRAAGR